jgi:hypothetical protein
VAVFQIQVPLIDRSNFAGTLIVGTGAGAVPTPRSRAGT